MLTRKSFVILSSWERETNRTISRLVPSKVSLKIAGGKVLKTPCFASSGKSDEKQRKPV